MRATVHVAARALSPTADYDCEARDGAADSDSQRLLRWAESMPGSHRPRSNNAGPRPRNVDPDNNGGPLLLRDSRSVAARTGTSLPAEAPRSCRRRSSDHSTYFTFWF